MFYPGDSLGTVTRGWSPNILQTFGQELCTPFSASRRLVAQHPTDFSIRAATVNGLRSQARPGPLITGHSYPGLFRGPTALG